MKVFGIGLTRTGTTSLSEALEQLGFFTRQNPSMRKILSAQWIKIKELRRFEAFTDAPIALNYQKLDNKYPNSKFIYTYRDVDSWLVSCKSYIRFKPNYPVSPQVAFIRRQLYGSIYFNEYSFREAYLRHDEQVRSYFANRDDFLVMNIVDGDNWNVLCPFLGKPIPSKVFPARNMDNIPDNIRAKK